MINNFEDGSRLNHSHEPTPEREISLGKKLVTVAEDPVLGPVLGPYITHFKAGELVRTGEITKDYAQRLTSIGVRNIDTWIPVGNEDETGVTRIFADENAERAWRINQAVRRLSQILPPEDGSDELRPVSFDGNYHKDGLRTILATGTAVGTWRKGYFLVPERTLSILDALNIPYRGGFPDGEK